MRRIPAVFLLGFLVLVGVASAAGPKLTGSVGPGFTISLRGPDGADVTKLDPGPFELTVDDLGDEHNFHLKGPGVDVATEVAGVGKQTFQLTLKDGTYTFVCDQHGSLMGGQFTVGTGGSTGTTPTPPPTTKPVTASAPVGAQLVLTTGPGLSITLKTLAGKKVTALHPGGYTIVVRDRSKAHNVRLLSTGASQSTTLPFTGTKTWKVTLRKGTLTFRCDAHQASMRGTVAIS
jgi:plastocyanin